MHFISISLYIITTKAVLLKSVCWFLIMKSARRSVVQYTCVHFSWDMTARCSQIYCEMRMRGVHLCTDVLWDGTVRCHGSTVRLLCAWIYQKHWTNGQTMSWKRDHFWGRWLKRSSLFWGKKLGWRHQLPHPRVTPTSDATVPCA